MIRRLADKWKYLLYLTAVFGWLISGAVALRTLPYGNIDYSDYLLPWYRYILAHGRFDAFGQPFSNYTPPYLYLMSLGSLLDGWLPPVVIIKLISLVFVAVAAIPVYRICRLGGRSREISMLAALIFCALPEVVLNSATWGQCDIIYTGFLLFFAAAILEGRSTLAAVMLGVAFAFKLQTILVGPVVLYLLLIGALAWWQLLLVPLVYLVLILPAALAGRGWIDLLTIYLGQFEYYHRLSMYAPNPYLLVDAYFPGYSEIGVTLALILAVVASLALVAAFLRRGQRITPDRLVFMLTLTLTLEPYILPKMHERYFFPAGVFAYLLLVLRPRTWPVAVLLQLTSIFTYRAFFRWNHDYFTLSAIPVTMALGLLLWWFLRDGDELAAVPRCSDGRAGAPAGRLFSR